MRMQAVCCPQDRGEKNKIEGEKKERGRVKRMVEQKCQNDSALQEDTSYLAEKKTNVSNDFGLRVRRHCEETSLNNVSCSFSPSLPLSLSFSYFIYFSLL